MPVAGPVRPHKRRRASGTTWFVAILVGAGLVSFVANSAAAEHAHLVRPGHAAQTAKAAAPTPSSRFTAESPADPSAVTAPDSPASVAVDSSSVTSTTAVALLATLPVRPALSIAGYNRVGDFGEAWLDVDRNGCDTRNDVLARDLSGITRAGGCRVLTGSFVSPYTGLAMSFVRGVKTSALVQIDHVVALGDAWETGAQSLTQAQRVTLANDPLELLAVDGRSNEQKGDRDAASWLPSNSPFDCTYVARQVSVKVTYSLWVTQAEHDAMAKVLATCPNAPGTASPFAPVPPVAALPVAAAPVVHPVPAAPAPVVHPAPAAPAPAPPAAQPVVHPGAFCSTAGALGVTTAGTAMVCKTTATDSRLRWRAA